MARWSLVAVAAVLVSGAVGCSVRVEGDDPFADHSTRGDGGTLRFQYDDPACGLLGRGCGLDRPFLTGSESDVEIKEGPSSGHVVFAFEGAAATVVSQDEWAYCNAPDGSFRRIGLDEGCVGSETKDAFRHVTLRGASPGEGKLVVRDARTGVELDRVTVRVASAVDVRLDVTRKGPADESYVSVIPNGDRHQVKVSDSVQVRAEPLDASGAVIRVGRHGVAHEYGNRDVLAPEVEILGSSETETMKARQSGDASLVVRAGGATRALRFQVVRP